ncbi:MAG: leucine-rich repeat protein [Clostridia bacterium]|nr:leucine-rich repeat protein [Clostridia bacterium]
MKIKKLIALFLSALMLLSVYSAPAFAAEIVESGTCNENLTWTLDSDGLLTISGSGELKNDFSNGSPFLGKNTIKTIVINNEVTSIGRFALCNCTSFTSVNIPDSVTSIGIRAFYGCTSLTNVNIPDSVTSIGSSAFNGCTSLKSVNIPDSVTSIGGSVFEKCTSLTSVNIPDSVTSLGGSAFFDCSSLISVKMPESVTSIGTFAFSGCTSLTSVNIPNRVTSIEYGDFWGCKSLKSVNIPDGVTSIGTVAFFDCTSLTSVNIPDSVTSIGDYAFRNCSDNLIFFGYAGSYAQEYAKQNNIKFVPMDDHTHSFTFVVTRQATCAKEGIMTCTCTVCGTTKTETIAKTNNHEWEQGKVTVSPTTEKTGVKTYTCTVCGTTKTEILSKLGNAEVNTSVIAERSGTVYCACGVQVGNLIKAVDTGAKALDKDGKEVKSTDKICSGMSLVKPEGSKETVVVKGDNDGDGAVTASDARFALRTAVSLEKPNDWEMNASDVDGENGITASDARLILRAAVNLEKLKLY